MRALFLIFHGFDANNKGISKKILSQVKAMNDCGFDTKLCYLEIDQSQHHKRMIDDSVLIDYGTGFKAKLKKRTEYSALTNYIFQNEIGFVYVRSAHNANPYLISMLRKLKEKGVKVVMEIPTFPYDQEYKGFSLQSKIQLSIDQFYRHKLSKYLYRIVTFSDNKNIFGVPTINISNGIDFDQIKLKTHTNNTSKQINLIGVAEIHYWHGFDRVIKGLAEYYKTAQPLKIVFNIVGDGVASERKMLKALVDDNHLGEYVIFHGTRSGNELADLFEDADMGIASLGRHRSNITNIKTLKNREYTARGIPFVYSEIDDDFEKMPYVLKAPADETPLNIIELVAFRNSRKFIPEEIRKSILHKLSWKTQMQKVIDEVLSSQ